MNGENRPMGPAPLPDNTPPTPPPAGGPPTGGTSPPPPPPPGAMPAGRQGAPGGGPPPPPPPQIDIRTMASDAESLKSSGGLGTEPKTFSPADLAKEPVFASEIVSPASTAVKEGGSGKKLAIALGAIAVLALAAAIGYFFVWPLFSGNKPESITEIIPPSLLPTETPSSAPAHQSYFKTSPAGGTGQVTLGSLTAAGLTSSLKTSSGEATSTGLVKEITLTANGNAVTSAQVLGVLLPGSELDAQVESDVTVFTYYGNNRSYPGYIFRLKSGADVEAANSAAAKIEASANLSALYPESPGAPKGGWKNGSVSGIATRYQAYSSAGASINYGWVDNYFVISTSFEGFKQAVDLLK